jgi:hypothetical protein
MKSEDAGQAIQKEMNRRRRYGGAEDVPRHVWGEVAVKKALLATMEAAVAEKFTGDWEEASLVLEEKMDALAVALRRASAQRTFLAGLSARGDAHRVESTESRAQGQTLAPMSRLPVLPPIVRRDAGSQALSDYYSWVLRGDEVAEEARRSICGDEYLTRTEAWNFLTSPLPKVLTHEDYGRWGLCPAKTKGRILAINGQKHRRSSEDQPFSKLYSWDGGTHTYTIEVQIPGEAEQPAGLQRLEREWDSDNLLYVSRRSLLSQNYLGHKCAEISEGVPEETPFFSDKHHFVEGYFGTVTGVLLDFANAMCSLYQVTLWDMLEALLTGVFPPQSAVEITAWDVETYGVNNVFPGGNFAARGPVTLTIQPWVTPEALADAWREHRKTNPCYSPSEKQADALQFVLSHSTPGEEFAWERLAAQWQEERGERMTRGTLYKQFERARAAILPDFKEEN